MNRISLLIFFIFNIIIFQVNATLSEEEHIERLAITDEFLENAPEEVKSHLRILIEAGSLWSGLNREVFNILNNLNSGLD
jgi:hypothetical protein